MKCNDTLYFTIVSTYEYSLSKCDKNNSYPYTLIMLQPIYGCRSDYKRF